MATKPRQIVPGRTWFVTGRAIARQHRFVPTVEVVHTLSYCLAATMQRYSVQLHGFVWMSNHYHLVLTDLVGQMPDFMRDLNSLSSKALNALRGQRGQNFERSGYNAVIVADRERALRHCAYTEANPCRASLVDTAQAWEGLTSARLEYGDTLSVKRPDFGLWGRASRDDDAPMDPRREYYCGRIKCPEVAEFGLTCPPNQGEAIRETRARVRGQVKLLEDEARAQRSAAERSVLGMEQARQLSPKSAPTNQEQYFGKEPTVSGQDPKQRKLIEQALAEFIERYRAALDEYKAKGKALFPEGTWWMKRYLKAKCYAYCASG